MFILFWKHSGHGIAIIEPSLNVSAPYVINFIIIIIPLGTEFETHAWQS